MAETALAGDALQVTISGVDVVLEGELPSLAAPPAGCRFHTRCSYAFERCPGEEPLLHRIGAQHSVACHLREVKAP